MKSTNLLNKLNIDNLTQLWRVLGSQRITKFGYQSHSWPHRLWVPWNEYHKTDHANELIESEVSGLFPVWDASSQHSRSTLSRLEGAGAPMYLQQTAMYIDLDSYDGNQEYPLEIVKINDIGDVVTWCDIVEKSFGYSVVKEVFHKVKDNPDVHLFLGMDGEQAVATSLLYKTGDVMGLHQVGVLPGVRKKGIATSITTSLLDYAKTLGCSLLTLQASTAGRNLYKRLGFEEQFVMKTFKVGEKEFSVTANAK